MGRNDDGQLDEILTMRGFALFLVMDIVLFLFPHWLKYPLLQAPAQFFFLTDGRSWKKLSNYYRTAMKNERNNKSTLQILN